MYSRHLQKLKVRLFINLLKAFGGCLYWNRMVRKYDVQRTVVVLFPGMDWEINYYGLLYLDKLLDMRGMEDAILIAVDEKVHRVAPCFSQRIKKTMICSRKCAEALMQYYCLYKFDNRFIILALDEPNGRKGSSILGTGGITVEELVGIGIYGLYPLYRPISPIYLQVLFR